MITKKTYRILFIIWSVLLISLTSYPKLEVPKTDIFQQDKIAHFIFYLIFAWLFVRMHGPQPDFTILKKTMLLALLVPILDELHQIPIPGRNFSIWDIVADMLGFTVVILIFYYKYRICKLKA